MDAATSTSPSKVRQLIWILVLVTLLGYLGWLGRTLMEAQDLSLDMIPASEPCDIRNAPCVASRDQQQILFAIDSEKIDSNHPIQMRVELAGIDADTVRIELQGADMFMGENSYSLKRQADGSYQAEGRLPVCTTDLMTWRATVQVSEGQRTLASAFDFDAR